jgi:hypothetical protein
LAALAEAGSPSAAGREAGELPESASCAVANNAVSQAAGLALFASTHIGTVIVFQLHRHGPHVHMRTSSQSFTARQSSGQTLARIVRSHLGGSAACDEIMTRLSNRR